jgi:hypothetical protein
MLQAQKGPGRVEIRALPLPAGASAQNVFAKVVQQEQSMGMNPAGSPTEFESGGLKFQRADFRNTVSSGELLETVLATTAKGNAIIITILTDSRGSMNDLAGGFGSGGVEAAKQGQAAK